eukprot:3524961-Pyramimonas_sp.AAC.1
MFGTAFGQELGDVMLNFTMAECINLAKQRLVALRVLARVPILEGASPAPLLAREPAENAHAVDIFFF